MVFYLVEHLEEGDKLSDWCRLEYLHMLENVNSPDMLIFTNVTSGQTRKFLTRENSITTNQPLSSFLDGEFLRLPGNLPAVKFTRACLLDMKAASVLSPEDANQFEAVVFGGILGNVHLLPDGKYSSDDKTSLVRKLGFSENRRHLGELQMTTDTAVLVTREILRNQKCFADLEFSDHPEIPTSQGDCTIMEGFRYLQKNGEIVIPPGMAELLADSMDFDLTAEL